MNSQSKTPREIIEAASVPTHSPRLGITGLILSTSGIVISVSTLLHLYISFFRAMANETAVVIPVGVCVFIVYCSLLVGIIGGVFGVVSLIRGKNKIASSISIVLGVLMICIGGMFTYIIMELQRMAEHGF